MTKTVSSKMQLAKDGRAKNEPDKIRTITAKCIAKRGKTKVTAALDRGSYARADTL